MKKYFKIPSLKDLAERFTFALIVIKTISAMIDLLGKVVNYARKILEFRLLLQKHEGKAGICSYSLHAQNRW